MMNNIIRLRRRIFTYRSKGKKSIADEPEARNLLEILSRSPCDPGNLFKIIQKVFDEQVSAHHLPSIGHQEDHHHGQGHEVQGKTLLGELEAHGGAPGVQEKLPEPGIPPFSISKLPG